MPFLKPQDLTVGILTFYQKNPTDEDFVSPYGSRGPKNFPMKISVKYTVNTAYGFLHRL